MTVRGGITLVVGRCHREPAGLQNMNDKRLLLAGGLPIEISGEVICGIGVGEDASGYLDTTCAQAGLGRIGVAPSLPGPT